MAPLGSDRIVVGVDFGTTFSGVAESYSAKPTTADEVHVIKTWPGGNNKTSDKVPSEIAYSDLTIAPGSHGHSSFEEEVAGGWSLVETDTFDFSELKTSLEAANSKSGGDPTVRWGFQLQPHETRIRCMKLLLDPHQPLPTFVSRSDMEAQLAESGKSAAEVVAYYLHEIYMHAKAELIKRYGTLFVETTAVHWVLTVPAVWSDTAKDATLTAAKQAGMGPDLTLISEPEAAVVYTLQAIQPNHLKKRDNFVVCDAGGGTVDLISYEIKESRPLRIEESAEGSGACCGGVMLNIGFERYIRHRLGTAAFDRLRSDQPRTWIAALTYFEDYVKRNFDIASSADFHIPLPGMADDEKAGVEQGFLTMPANAVASIFAPIITDIIRLVEGQISKLQRKGKLVAGVVLVGGFGQSRCLYQSLRYHFFERSAPPSAGFEIMQPANAWTAVVRGAVLRGLEGAELVVSRKSRRHYGIVTRAEFVDGVHPVSCKAWDDLNEKWMADNRMTWYIKKGWTVSSTKSVLKTWYSRFTPGHSRTVTYDLIVCDEDRAPDGYESYAGSPTKSLCKLTVNLNSVPAALWKERRTTDGRPYKGLSFQIGMQITSGGLNFDMRVDDVVYGAVTATFD